MCSARRVIVGVTIIGKPTVPDETRTYDLAFRGHFCSTTELPVHIEQVGLFATW